MSEHLGLSCSSNRGPTSWVRVFYRRVFSVTGSEHSTLQTLVDITEMTDGSKMAGIQNIRRQLDGVPDRIAVAKTKCIAARKLL
ncbi:uncharacterized protein LOC107262935 isoform X4 [Cephus cinctus]|uniref:Uncharacterized protein LOC107262935 isoform X4 n=1 Tax=Cephus cinctus TaxID=211228 RepID=A0AAJ7FCK2_CEPCN|nr:uncharacterized protein LOC107262935 isoform X4 [Cephus cinctus]